jgi:hypothetical protein
MVFSRNGPQQNFLCDEFRSLNNRIFQGFVLAETIPDRSEYARNFPFCRFYCRFWLPFCKAKAPDGMILRNRNNRGINELEIEEFRNLNSKFVLFLARNFFVAFVVFVSELGAQAPGTGKGKVVSTLDAANFLPVFFYLRFFVILRVSLALFVTILVQACPG